MSPPLSDGPSHHLYQIDETTVSVSLQEPDPSAHVPEALVHDLWRYQRFDAEALTTTDGEPVRILQTGRPNTDAGPDFVNAHVRIGSMDWRGHVEIHRTSGDWFAHDHHTDARYDSVILHVTLHADVWTGGLLRADETTLPEIVLYPRLESPLRELLHNFRTRHDEDALPCASRWSDVTDETKHKWIDELARERLAAKQSRLARQSDRTLVERLHERLFAGLGYAKNDEPMSMLARRLPPRLVQSIDDPRNREALHLGVAGLLPKPKDLLDTDRETADYAMELRDRFRRLRVQFDVPTMDRTSWTFFRLRPNNFPPLRIAQAAAWYEEGGLLAEEPLKTLRSALAEEHAPKALRDRLSATPSAFWRTHYHLTKAASEHDPSLGPSRTDTLLVNAVLPILLLDAQRQEKPSQRRAAIHVLQAIGASKDRVVRRFEKLGTSPDSAFEAQGLHQLYREYCTEGGCLECHIGRSLLNS